jgi:hypothetical protein
MFITRLLFALALLVATFAQEVEEGVLVLTDANFEQVSKKRVYEDVLYCFCV